MNPSTPSNLAAISSLHAHFKAHPQWEFAYCEREKSRPVLSFVHFSIHDAQDTALMSLSLRMDLDLEKFRAALEEIPRDQWDGINIVDNELKLDGFMEQRAFEVVQHLKAYNGVADDYEAIVELARKVRGAITAKKYDV